MLKAKKYSLFILIFGGYLWLAILTLYPPLPSSKVPLKLYSNQLRDDLKQTFVSAIKQAKTSIVLQIYGLTDPDILALLEKKQAEGVKVDIFYDKSASKFLPKSLHAFPVKSKGLMHRKILVVDGALVLLGTANCTPQSLKMHDNLLIGVWNQEWAHFLEQSIEEAGAFNVGKTTFTSFLLPCDTALDALCACIDHAEKEICIAMFTLTHNVLINRLIQAKQRGVKVSLAVDRYTAEGASQRALKRLQQEGVEIFTSMGNQLLHHKWAFIDRNVFAFGSANWTEAAFEKNQDCLVIMKDLTPQLQKKLIKLWETVAIASENK